MRVIPQILGITLLLTSALHAEEVTFQQGVDNYSGAVDTEIWEVSPNKALARNGQMTVDADNGGGQSHVLIKFHDVFGDKPRQVPKGARILEARLVVLAFDPGNSVNLHRMLSPWDGSASISAGRIEKISGYHFMEKCRIAGATAWQCSRHPWPSFSG